jgi:hypothetical protein
LRKCIADAGQEFHRLPKAYYGIVRSEVLDRVRSKAGSYFPGVSPDLAAAVALANVARKVCVLDYPLFVPGASLRSNAGLGGLGRHIGTLAEQNHLGPDCEKKWSTIIPPFFSVETIWAEAAVEALQAMGRTDLLPIFNLPKLYAWLFMFYPRFARLSVGTMFSALRQTHYGLCRGLRDLVKELWLLVCLRAHYFKKRFQRTNKESQSMQRFNGICDIKAAVNMMNTELRRRGVSFATKVEMTGATKTPGTGGRRASMRE